MPDVDQLRVASPCTKVCVVDPRGSGICLGCGRTLDEIAGWIDLSDDERRAVLARLPARLAGVGSDGLAVRPDQRKGVAGAFGSTTARDDERAPMRGESSVRGVADDA